MNDHELADTSPQVLDDADSGCGTDLAQHLADIAAVLLAPGAVNAAGRITSLAVHAMESCEEAGLCGDAGQPEIEAPSALMTTLERLQTEAGHGPCQDALAGSALIYVVDLLDDQRWPLFSPEAARLGMRSVLAYRLSFGGQTMGALQLYSHLPAAFNC